MRIKREEERDKIKMVKMEGNGSHITIILKYILVGVLLMTIFCMPVSAWCSSPVYTWTHGTVKGGVYIDGGESSSSYTFNVPEGEIKWARLYWRMWMPGDYTYAQFCNANGDCWYNTLPLGCYHNENEGVYFGGYGTYWAYWNVTDYTTSGINTALIGGPVTDIVLIAVYENPEEVNTTYWINQGFFDIGEVQELESWFYGSVEDVENKTAQLWVIKLKGGHSDALYFNDEMIVYGTCAISQDNGFTLFGLDVTSLLGSSDNHIKWVKNPDPGNISNPYDNHMFVTNAVLVYKDIHGTGIPDLTATGIEFPEIMRPGYDYLINAFVRNTYCGGDWSGACAGPFNVSLYVDGEFSEKKRVESGLPPSAVGIPVNFTVNLPEGCYEFKVVVDADSEVNESNEHNNVTSENYQSGYNIVVKNNSDFDYLLWEDPGLPSGSVITIGDTYYIQGLTIENCGGKGIRIENTDVPFVIRNCTVQNCAESGIYLYNVTNGTIVDCTIQNNWGKGILVKNSTFVNITNNTVQDNWNRGMAVHPEIIHSEFLDDSKFVNIMNNKLIENYYCGIELIGCNCTVKHNTIGNNSGYGIYVYGNNSEIYCNEIKYNSDYGIKLYNSSGNCIYGNDFIGNNP